MAVKSLYFKNVTTNGALSLQDGGTAPATGITTTGWTVAKLASPNLSIMAAGTKKTAFVTSDPMATASFSAASCWRTENPLVGDFANTSWTMAFRVRAVSSASSQTGAVKVRVWRSANADGTGATQITSALLTGTTTAALSTTASGVSTVTWASPGIQAFVNEYLWVQCEWSIVTTGGANGCDSMFYVESAGVVTTPNFTDKITGTGTLSNTSNPSTLASTGVGSSSGTGALSRNSTLIATGLSTSTGTGTIPSVGSTLAGIGVAVAASPPQAAVSWIELSGVEVVVLSPVTGTGVLASVSTTIASTGIGSSSGTGTISSVVSTLISTGLSTSTGTGVLLVATAVIISIDTNIEYLYPDADIVIGGWTDQANGTTNLYQAVDETTANDTDYVQSSIGPNADIIRFRMSDPTTGVGVPFNVSYRYGVVGAGLGCTITARLKQGSTTIKSWAHTDAALTLKTVSQPLSAGELASITNFNDLFVEFEAGP